MSPDRILILNADEVSELLPLEHAIAAVKAAYEAHARGEARLFPFVRERLDTAGSVCGIKSAYWPTRNLVGLKLAGYWPGNTKANLANHQATVMLAEASSGRLLGVLDGNVITSRRTAAAGVLAARVLARPRPRSLTLLGCGAQGKDQTAAMLASFDSLKEIRLWDRDSQRAEQLASTLRGSAPGVKVSVCPHAVEAVRNADLIVTATASTSPLIASADVDPGSHINAMGSDTSGKRELDPRLIERCILVVDDLEQSRQLGELQAPASRQLETATIGDVLLGRHPGRTSDDQITVFDSTGIGLQDVAAADFAYREAIRQGRGTQVSWTATPGATVM